MIHSDQILAAAYKRDIPREAMLNHAVSDIDIEVGRLRRSAGEAFCKKTLNTAGYFQPANQVNCPKCLQILSRIP